MPEMGDLFVTNQNHAVGKNILLVDIVIDLCGGLSYMTFAVAAWAGSGRCAVIASLPPPLGGAAAAAGTKLRNKWRRRGRGREEGRKGRRGSDIVGRALSSLCSTGCGEWGWDRTGHNLPLSTKCVNKCTAPK